MASKRERELKGKIDCALLENMNLHKYAYDANEILKDITNTKEGECFAENGLIPCKADCARTYEEVYRGLQRIKSLLENSIAEYVKYEPLLVDENIRDGKK
jgi:hypothetical protein